MKTVIKLKPTTLVVAQGPQDFGNVQFVTLLLADQKIWPTLIELNR